MHGAGDGLAEDLPLENADRQQVLDPRRWMIEAILRESQPQKADESLNVQREEAGGDDEDQQEHDYPGHMVS